MIRHVRAIVHIVSYRMPYKELFQNIALDQLFLIRVNCFPPTPPAAPPLPGNAALSGIILGCHSFWGGNNWVCYWLLKGKGQAKQPPVPRTAHNKEWSIELKLSKHALAFWVLKNLTFFRL